MDKAKQKALEAYPVKIAPRDGYDENLRERKGFIKGYHQADKDLELTWEDIEKIVDLYDDVHCDFSNDGNGGKINAEEHYQEVLKRFKSMKDEWSRYSCI